MSAIVESQELSWIKGGPFLEVSFLLELKTSRQEFIGRILTDLTKVSPRVEVVLTETDLAKLKDDFVKGYPVDEKDENSAKIHSVSIPAYIHFSEMRRAYIRIQQISDDLGNISFDFFGSAWDAPEWGQKGVKDTDLPIFVDLLKKLFETFTFPLGTIGFEYDSTDLFSIDECWPSSGYDLAKLDKARIEKIDDTDFIYILVNKSFTLLPAVQKAEDSEKYLLLERSK